MTKEQLLNPQFVSQGLQVEGYVGSWQHWQRAHERDKIYRSIVSLRTSYEKCNYVRLCSVAQSSLTLCDSMDCSLPDSSVHGILQARILEYWVAIITGNGLPFPPPEDLPDPGIELVSPALASGFFFFFHH